MIIVCYRKAMSHVVGEAIRENEPLLWEVSQNIWKNPELGYKEKYAHELLTTTLEKLGFDVQKHYFLPTAFRAEFGSGEDGPTVAVICEYDALPGIGHACGHNLIAEIGLAAGIAVKAAMENDPSIRGKIVVLGTPAEEEGSGKIKLIERGAFRDVDSALMAHPQAVDRLYPLILELAKMTVKFRALPDGDPCDGPSAVDAAVSCYNSVAVMRRQLNSRWRISGIIPTSSDEESEMVFIYRAPTHRDLRSIREKLELCVKAAALSTGCRYYCNHHEESSKSETKGMVHNRSMTEVFAKHAGAMGVVFRDDDRRYCESAVSTDMGNVSHVVPGIQPEYSIGAAPYVNHTAGFAEVAGSPLAQHSTLVIAEALAKTVVDLMSNPELMRKVKTEFENDPHRDPLVSPRTVGTV